MEPRVEAPSVRKILRDFIMPIVETEDEIDQNDLIYEAMMRFDNDEEFLEAAMRDLIPILVPLVLSQIVRGKKHIIRTPSGAVSQEKVERTARERFAWVFEGSGAGYRTILQCNRQQLLELVSRDQKQIDSMQAWNECRLDLANRLKGDQVVGDLSSRVLEQVWAKHMGT